MLRRKWVIDASIHARMELLLGSPQQPTDSMFCYPISTHSRILNDTVLPPLDANTGITLT